MADQQLQIKAISIGSDIEDLFESYLIDELNDTDELNDFVSKISEVKRDFRRIYAQLKSVEGNEFETKYPNYNAQLDELNKKFKSSNDKLSALRKAKKIEVEKAEKLRAELESEKYKIELDAISSNAEEKKSRCKSERIFLVKQVNWELKECDWEKFSEFDEIKGKIFTFESRLESLYQIFSNLEGILGDEATKLGFTDENEQLVMCIREKINEGKVRFTELKENEIALKEKRENEKEISEAKRQEFIKRDEEIKMNNLISCAKNLQFEIKTRYSTFIAKCTIDISKLSDYEILHLKKREDNLYSELREIIDKISSFEKFVLPCGDLVSKLREEVIEMRDDSTIKIDCFFKQVREIVSDRDISEKKLENSAGLKIELPKFKGYHSEMDVYTFRSEFSKLIEPIVQNYLWADYLKKNCLAGAAYNLVCKMGKIEEIWKKLIEVYGDTRLMFHNKLSSLDKFSNLEKLKDDEKIAYTITSLLNAMSDLSKLAQEYDLEGELYHGGGLQKILEIMGNFRERKFIKSIATQKPKNKQKWNSLVEFLKHELREREAFVLNEKAKKCMNVDYKSKFEREKKGKDSEREKREEKGDVYWGKTCVCHICDKSENHVLSADGDGKPCIEYIACKMFVDLKPRERDKVLYKKRLCSKCLKPGVKWNSDHLCDKKYACNQTYSKNGNELKCEKHVLVCGYHANEKSNKDLLDFYKKNVFKANNKFLDFSKAITISCFAESYSNDQNRKEDSSVYAFQTIDVGGVKFNLFYDSGCGDLIVSKESVDKLREMGLAKQKFPGPIILNGVGNQKSICEHGVYNINLPLENGSQAKMSGLCVDDIAVPFPRYPLKRVEEYFRKEIAKTNKNILAELPKLPDYVGGKVNVMIGKQYLKYFPNEIAQLESGLTLYKSRFKSPDGSNGVIAGPHPEFTKIDRMSHFSHDKRYTFYSPSVQAYNEYVNLIGEVPLLGNKEIYVANSIAVQSFLGNDCAERTGNSIEPSPMITFPGNVVTGDEFDNSISEKNLENLTISDEVYVSKRRPKCLKIFEKVEESGTDTSYRCMKCRNCQECINGSFIEEISIQEEVEQTLINKSVTLDVQSQVCTAKLPFIADPDSRLVSNRRTARKVYDAQTRKLEKSPKDRADIIEAEGKLHKLGYVDYLNNLSEDDRNLILNSVVNYFIPWLVVWSKSISTPVRPVFDASQSTPGGCSLNEILAKGINSMNNLVQILIRWTIRSWAFHTDIRKMYNAVQLDKTHWRFQLYLWQKELDSKVEPEIKVIKTLIYGVKSSGNQAERAVRMTAEKCKNEYPEAYDIIQNDIYVDDCISGTHTEEELMSVTENLKLCLEEGSFTLKGFTFSGKDPDDTLSNDKESVSVGGLKWYPKEDYLKLNINELNFARKIRGRKCENTGGIPEKLTMRDCVSKVAELFDPLGRITPLLAGMKLDVSYLHRSGLTWDDQIPENLRSIWTSNFEMMQEIGEITYKRAIVPQDAKNLEIVTIDKGDASSKLICAAIYARFEKKDGSFSCQLVFSRSKVLPEDTTIPRAELMAAGMNAATGHTVKKAFGSYHKRAVKLSDSMVVLHWIQSKKTALKTWVRNRVHEIHRLCEVSAWRYVESSNMVADLGTRKGAKISDVIEGSKWINGLSWMSGPEEDFPVFKIDEMKLNKDDVSEADKEKLPTQSYYSLDDSEFNARIDNEIKLRYDYSSYLIDPNRFRFRKVVRILGLVLCFIKNCSKNIDKIQKSNVFCHKSPSDLPKSLLSNGDKYIVTTGRLDNMGSGVCAGGKVIQLSDNMLKSAMYYFAAKTSLEVKKFLKKEKYDTITRDIDSVLYYVGRIPSDYAFDGYPELCKEAIDLCQTTFCVPVMDQYSPVAISIALEIHWYHPVVKHTGIEIMFRQQECIAHIIGGRQLVKSIKSGCKKCRILNKKSIDVVMGPIQKVNLCIAPAFYACQIDIFGAYKSYSNANKRATIKVWFLVMCCCTTGATDIRVMEDYSTDSFIQAFIRFCCRFGYPKYVLPDAGSQLVKGCENMKYSFSDSKQKLHREYGVEFMACPVGAHYVHGKVERKIRQIKKCVGINIHNERLSIIQWETLVQQISNCINNLPIGLKNKSENLENLDLITPNRLILGRNNERCPNAPLTISGDHKKMIEKNANIFKAWFNAWIVNYVPLLIERPKWQKSDKQINIGDIVLFLKSEKEFDLQYQYGIVSHINKGQDDHIRRVDVRYRNHNETTDRVTQRGVRDLIIVYPIDELDINERLSQMVE